MASFEWSPKVKLVSRFCGVHCKHKKKVVLVMVYVLLCFLGYMCAFLSIFPVCLYVCG